MKRTTTMLAAVMVAAAVAAPAAMATPANALQPANVYFGQVVAGNHPTQAITVKNVTSRNQYVRRFDLAGAGGGKFTLTWGAATCYAGLNLKPGATCTIVVRVKTERPEFWQSTVSVYYGPRIMARPARGQFNGSVYAHVVA